MNRSFSLYLDFIRFFAAMLVFISHVPGFAGGWLWQIAGFGHEAVVVFFVLSGFVIAFVVYDKKESAIQYAASRLSRIYSVALPALLLTLTLYYSADAINHESLESLNQKLGDPIWTTLAALTFTNQSWIASPVFSNLPYWSLGYEVLYYVFFGVLAFCTGFSRIVLLAVVALVMGPSIILYLPVWLAGVFCFKYLHSVSMTFRASLYAYVVSIMGVAALCIESLQNMINSFVRQQIGDGFYAYLLEPAELFASDYLLTIFVTLHMFSSYHLIRHSEFFKIRGFVELSIKTLSSHTFSLYLFHMPILFFVSAVLPYKEHPVANVFSCWVATPLIIFAISYFTEKQKSRYKVFFEELIRRCTPKL
jgi:peptidoglycan/LPS O-acetylase OafA/YrhL